MNELKLNSNKYDVVLSNYIKDLSSDLIACASGTRSGCPNRGDLFEMAITGAPVKRNGLHEMSDGDFIFNGLRVEIKYLSVKTKASAQMKGTSATHYLIGFNNGNSITLRLIKKEDIVIENNHISYQNNLDKGVALA